MSHRQHCCTVCGVAIKLHVGRVGKNHCHAASGEVAMSVDGQQQDHRPEGEDPIEEENVGGASGAGGASTEAILALTTQVGQMNNLLQQVCEKLLHGPAPPAPIPQPPPLPTQPVLQPLQPLQPPAPSSSASGIATQPQPPPSTTAPTVQPPQQLHFTAPSSSAFQLHPFTAAPTVTQGSQLAHGKLVTYSVSDKMHRSIIAGEYVNMSDLITPEEHCNYGNDELVPVMEKDSVQFRHKPKKHCIDNFGSWLAAWSIFERVMVLARPSLYALLSDYRMFVQKCDSKYQWHATFAYDCRFRETLANNDNKFAYNVIDTNLYVTIFDILSVRSDAKLCFRCKSAEHVVLNCPFQAPTQTSEEKTKNRDQQGKASSRQPRWYHGGYEGCNNFQTGNCRYPQCQRAHVCRNCRGAEPLYMCSRCNR